MTALDLEAIRRRVEAAREPPWEWRYGDREAEVMPRRLVDQRGHSVLFSNDEEEPGPLVIHGAAVDMDLIAHAPADIRALLAEVERLRMKRPRLTAKVVRGLHHVWGLAKADMKGEQGALHEFPDKRDDALAALRWIRCLCGWFESRGDIR